MSLDTGAYLFQGTEYVKFAYDQVEQDSTYPRSISDFGLLKKHFSSGVSAAIRYWNTNEVDFFSYDGYRQRWKFGVGNIGVALKNPGLGVTTQTIQQNLQCRVPDCVTCNTESSCSECDTDYVLATGRCYPKNYMVEIEFDAQISDFKYIKETSFDRTKWGEADSVTGITNNGMFFTTVDFIDIIPPTTPLKDFEFHFWIKLSKISTFDLISGKAKSGMDEISMKVLSIPGNKPNVWNAAYQFRDVFVKNDQELQIDEWDHLIFTYLDGFVQATVNGVKRSLPDTALSNFNNDDNAEQQQPPIYLTEISIGRGTGWDGTLDQFHLDNLNIPYSQSILGVSSSSHMSFSFWFLCFCIISYYCIVF